MSFKFLIPEKIDAIVMGRVSAPQHAVAGHIISKCYTEIAHALYELKPSETKQTRTPFFLMKAEMERINSIFGERPMDGSTQMAVRSAGNDIVSGLIDAGWTAEIDEDSGWLKFGRKQSVDI